MKERLLQNPVVFPFVFGYMGYHLLRGDPEHHSRPRALVGAVFLFGCAVYLQVTGVAKDSA